jgi:hypothetical protein
MKNEKRHVHSRNHLHYSLLPSEEKAIALDFGHKERGVMGPSENISKSFTKREADT